MCFLSVWKNIINKQHDERCLLLCPQVLCNMMIPSQGQESLISNLLASVGFDHRVAWESVLLSPCENIHRHFDIFSCPS